jgi:hypothetical protein
VTRIFPRFVVPLVLALGVVMVGAMPASAHKRAQFPVQSLGDRGADVVTLQHLLRARGRSVAVSGFFGSETRSALIGYQQSVGLGGSGVAFVSSWEAIVPQLSQGSSGEAVLALKKQLNAKRKAGLALTSMFDSATRTAVRTLQGHMGLSKTGVVDKTTWRNLVWHYIRPQFSRPSLCNYNGGNAHADWGTASAIAHLEAAADLFRQRAGGKVAVGDISHEHGGPITYHATHEDGLDIDVALIRLDGRQCRRPGISYKSAKYDRADTRQLLRAVRDIFGSHLKLVYFNDPQLIAEGLSQRYPNHDDHIHIRVCEPAHAKTRYVC